MSRMVNDNVKRVSILRNFGLTIPKIVEITGLNENIVRYCIIESCRRKSM